VGNNIVCVPLEFLMYIYLYFFFFLKEWFIIFFFGFGSKEKTECLIQQYEAISLLNSERYARLERAQVLVNQFWETYEELSPWIEETRGLIAQLPPPAIDHEQLRQQQEEMRVRDMPPFILLQN
jgi:hypothetical protein